MGSVESELELSYKAYLLSWLMADIETKIDSPPLCFEQWKSIIDKALNEREVNHGTVL